MTFSLGWSPRPTAWGEPFAGTFFMGPPLEAFEPPKFTAPRRRKKEKTTYISLCTEFDQKEHLHIHPSGVVLSIASCPV